MQTEMSTSGVLGVGYEGRTIEGLLTELEGLSVDTVVDVRLHPISRKRGLSKRALATVLADSGIGYVHLPELGNPRPNRPGFAGSQEELAAARATYRGLIDTEAASAALQSVAELASTARVGLLCFEADEERCHRHVILDRLRSGSVTLIEV